MLDALVRPVCGGPVFGHVVHALGAYLHLQVAALAVLYRDVQTLVTAGTGGGDPVAQPLCVGFVFFGNVRIYFPAEVFFGRWIVVAVDDEADGEHIVHTLERNLLHLHLAPYRPGALGADLKLVGDACVGELLLERLDKFAGQALPFFFRGLELVGDGSVLLGLGVAEIDVAQLAVDVVQAELVRQRHIEHERLEELLVTRGLGKNVQMAHHLKPVGYLDDAHPRVGRVLDN